MEEKKKRIIDFSKLNPSELELLAKFDDLRRKLGAVVSEISIKQILDSNDISLKCLNLTGPKSIPEGYCKYYLDAETNECGLGGKCYIVVIKEHVAKAIRDKR